MTKYQILENVFRQNISSYDEIPENKRKLLLRNFLNENLEKILLKIKLPDLRKLKMDMILEKCLNDRRSPKGRKRSDRKVNYNLWRFLFEAKAKMNFNISKNSLFEEQTSNEQTTIIKSGSGFSHTYSQTLPELPSPACFTKIPIVIQFKMDSVLEDKIIASKPHAEFVKCLDIACRTTGIDLTDAEFYLHETIDKENPKWIKIILDVKFKEASFEDKMEKWEKIRDIIDASILKLIQTHSALTELTELEKKLFINMVL